MTNFTTTDKAEGPLLTSNSIEIACLTGMVAYFGRPGTALQIYFHYPSF